jgi:hypothetical protein
MKTSNDVVMELLERDNQASDYEDLIADIKSTLESPFTSDETKLKYIRQSFRDYDL